MTEDFISRLRTIYENERSWAVGRAEGTPTDLRDTRHAALLKGVNEIVESTREEQTYALVEHAIATIAVKSDKQALPRFDDGGHVQLKIDGIIRVGENLVVAVQFATQDDWLAYLGIKRENAERQMRGWRATETGINRIVADVRAYGSRTGIAIPRTFDACPWLFDQRREASA